VNQGDASVGKTAAEELRASDAYQIVTPDQCVELARRERRPGLRFAQRGIGSNRSAETPPPRADGAVNTRSPQDTRKLAVTRT